MRMTPDFTSNDIKPDIGLIIEVIRTIISDCWRAYEYLKNGDYNHLTVNHTYNFADHDTGAHTNNIEKVWRGVRRMVQTMAGPTLTILKECGVAYEEWCKLWQGPH